MTRLAVACPWPDVDLLALAERVVAAGPGPASRSRPTCARSRTTTVRAYGGEVESLSSATSAGIGVRVVVDGRQGFAYAGTPRRRRASTRRWPRPATTPSSPPPDEANGLAEPDGVAPADARPRAGPGVERHPDRRKVELALALERAVPGRRPPDPRRAGGHLRRPGRRGGAGLQHRARGLRRGHDVLAVRLGPGRRGRRAPRPATASTSAAARTELDVEGPPAEAVERATRMLGARQPATRRVTVVLEPSVAASFLGVHRRGAHRRGRAEGPLAVRRPGRRGGGRRASPWSTTRPTRRSLGAGALRRRGAGLPAAPR